MSAPDIRTARLSLGLTQAQLGEELGVHPNTIAKWERGDQAPEHPEMLRLALDKVAQKVRRRRP